MDCLEIQNPGTLPLGMTVDDIKTGVSNIRNRVIARVMRELDLMETWGTGYKRMREACEAGGYPLPDWIELGTVTRTVLRPHPDVAEGREHAVDVSSKATPTERERILDYVRMHGSITNTECRELLGIAVGQASYRLATLAGEGKLTRSGKLRWTRYTLP